jgi:hypothetical protein
MRKRSGSRRKSASKGGARKKGGRRRQSPVTRVKRVAVTVVEQARDGVEKLVDTAGDLYHRIT